MFCIFNLFNPAPVAVQVPIMLVCLSVSPFFDEVLSSLTGELDPLQPTMGTCSPGCMLQSFDMALVTNATFFRSRAASRKSGIREKTLVISMEWFLDKKVYMRTRNQMDKTAFGDKQEYPREFG